MKRKMLGSGREIKTERFRGMYKWDELVRDNK